MKKVTNIEELKSAIEGTPFASDFSGDKSMNVQGKPMPRAVWNLLLSIRDCKLYSKGIRPHRFWKIGQVKEYFGIKGNADDMALILEEYYAIINTSTPIKTPKRTQNELRYISGIQTPETT